MPRAASVYEYAKMCQQVKFPAGGAVENWSCILLEDIGGTGFRAAAYQHTSGATPEIVLVFRGTEPTELGNLLSDYEIARSRQPDTYQAAFAFFIRVRAAHPDALIAVTGFSLGAVLAELTAVEYTTADDVIPAITFDSPGSRPLVNPEKVEVLARVQVITYMAKPNIINTCNEHIGRLLQVDFGHEIHEHASAVGALIGAAEAGGAISAAPGALTVLASAELVVSTLQEHKIDKFVTSLAPEANNVIYEVLRWPSRIENIPMGVSAVLLKEGEYLAPEVAELLTWYHCAPISRDLALRIVGHGEPLAVPPAIATRPLAPEDEIVSQINPRYTFNQYRWVVSVINTGSRFGGHAALIVEGMRGDVAFTRQYDIRAIAEPDPSSSLAVNYVGYIDRVVMRASYRPEGYVGLASRSFIILPEYFDVMERAIIADFNRITMAATTGRGHLRYQLVASQGILYEMFGREGGGVNCAQWCMEKLKHLKIDLGTKADKLPIPGKVTMSTLEKVGWAAVGGTALAALAFFGYRSGILSSAKPAVGSIKPK